MLNHLSFPNNITLIYGPPASGKTTICLQLIVKTKGQIIYIDTENSFNLDRLKQMDPNIDLEKLIVIRAKRYSEQFKAIKNLKDTNNISLVIVDSFTHFHRRKIQEKINVKPATIKMFQMLRDLGIPVILTSQIYTDMKGNNHPIAQELFKHFSKYTIILQNKILRIEQSNLEIPYIITNDGLTV
ncbi:AAA family ATPase [Candidatus Woesearchaeota archaeon]|nr:AAA family ATPase [Candidatus Woesearchaeota archaeon]